MTASHVRVDVVHLDGSAEVVVTGELDIGTSGTLRRELGAVLGNGVPVMLDLAHVSFMDSSGLNVLVEASNVLNGLGQPDVWIRTASPQVRRVLSLTGLEHMLEAGADTPGASGSNVASVSAD
jgi:anti-sigma B factor antagonist